MRRAVALFSLALTVAATGAAGPPTAGLAQAPGHDPRDCRCRAQGRMFALGESVCLKTPEGPRIARCQMAINVTSWALTETPCLDS